MSSTLPDSSVMSYNLADGALKSLREEVQVYHEQVAVGVPGEETARRIK